MIFFTNLKLEIEVAIQLQISEKYKHIIQQHNGQDEIILLF